MHGDSGVVSRFGDGVLPLAVRAGGLVHAADSGGLPGVQLGLAAASRGTAKISPKPAIGSVSPGQRGCLRIERGTPTWVVQSFREDSFSETNPALTSENLKLSAERPG
jgi:hypothetical protein